MCDFVYRWTIVALPAIWGRASPAKIGHSGLVTKTCQELLEIVPGMSVTNTDEILERWNKAGNVWLYEAESPRIDFSGDICRNCYSRTSNLNGAREKAFASGLRCFHQ